MPELDQSLDEGSRLKITTRVSIGGVVHSEDEARTYPTVPPYNQKNRGWHLNNPPEEHA